MNLKTSKKFTKFLIRNQIESGVRQAVFFWGEAGIGKTDMMRQAAKEVSSEDWFVEKYGKGVEMKCVNLRLATKPDAGDLVGLLRQVEVYPCHLCHAASKNVNDRFSQKELATHLRVDHKGASLDEAMKQAKTSLHDLIDYTTAYSAPRDIPLRGPALLFLDEFNRANRAVRDACFSLLEDGRAGPHQTGQDIIVVAAGNPPTKDYQVEAVDEEKAFMGRAIHIIVSPTKDEWMEHAFDTGHNETVLKAVVGAPEFLGTRSTSMEHLEKLGSGPREMSKISHLLNRGLIKEFGQGEVFVEILSGIIGAKDAVMFQARAVEKDQPIAPDDIINKYGDVSSIVKKYGSKDGSRFDLLHMTNWSLFHMLKKSEISLGKEQAKNIGHYIMDLPKDAAFAFIKMMTNESGKSQVFKHFTTVIGADPRIMALLKGLDKEMTSSKRGE